METTYKIIRKNKNPYEQLIEKEAMSKATFTLGEVVSAMSDLEKKEKEHKGQLMIFKMQKEALEKKFPKLTTLDPELVSACKDYYDTMFDIEQYEKSIKYANKAVKEYQKEVDTIKSKLGIE